jgi:N6-L-threonylcarbamoyladenine synthase
MTKILGIETSCDETAVAAIEGNQNQITILGNFVFSQTKIHKKFGGILPEAAARAHTIKLFPLLERLEKKVSLKDIDRIAVTFGPGLITSLMVGVELAKTLSYIFKKPLLPINHLEGHIYVNWLPSDAGREKNVTLKCVQYPVLALIVSGAHTELIFSKRPGNYKIIGQTLDDAAGEAFDKVAKLLKLHYPGGPVISRLAQNGNPKKRECRWRCG